MQLIWFLCFYGVNQGYQCSWHCPPSFFLEHLLNACASIISLVLMVDHVSWSGQSVAEVGAPIQLHLGVCFSLLLHSVFPNQLRPAYLTLCFYLQTVYSSFIGKRNAALREGIKTRSKGDSADSDSEDDRAPVPFNLHARWAILRESTFP